MESLNILLRYEKYIPVLSDEEQEGLLDQPPTLLQLQDWERRLAELSARTTTIEERFKRSYDKIIKHRHG